MNENQDSRRKNDEWNEDFFFRTCIQYKVIIRETSSVDTYKSDTWNLLDRSIISFTKTLK